MPFPRLWTHIRLAWEVTRHTPDALFVPAHVLPLAHPACSVATVHDLGYRYYPEAHTRFARWYLDWGTRFNARSSARVVVDSEATKRDLISLYHVDEDKIVVAYPAGTKGLRPVRDERILAEVRRRYGIGDSYYLYVGTLQPRKNIPNLLRAFAALVQKEDGTAGTSLVLAGKRGWLYEDLEELADELGLADRVVLTGYVPAEDLAPLLSGAIAYVLPSWYEGFGLPVLEAMRCETPVICSRVASLPEVAGDAALYFDPADVEALARRMRQVLHDATLRRRMVALGRERVRLFSWTRCARRVLSTLEAVAEEAALAP
jgi:glycosyltransferase involved in cell wall biosynthesis